MGRDWLHGSRLLGSLRRRTSTMRSIVASSYCFSGLWDVGKARATEEESQSRRLLDRVRRACLLWAASQQLWVTGAWEGSWMVSIARVMAETVRHRPLPVLGACLSALVVANGLAAGVRGMLSWPGLAGRAAVLGVALCLVKAEIEFGELYAGSRVAGLIRWFTTPDVEVGRP